MEAQVLAREGMIKHDRIKSGVVSGHRVVQDERIEVGPLLVRA